MFMNKDEPKYVNSMARTINSFTDKDINYRNDQRYT